MSIAVTPGASREPSTPWSVPAGASVWYLDPVRIVTSPSENKVQIFFASVPSDEVRAELKAFGFRWNPERQAWQQRIGPETGLHALRIALMFKEQA